VKQPVACLSNRCYEIWASLSACCANLPAITAVAVLTLAVAIGANAVVFGVMNALILRPLNVPEPQSLYEIERAGDTTAFESYPDYLDLRDRNRSFDGLAAFTIASAALDTDENPAPRLAL
jgi:hypothetical protein